MGTFQWSFPKGGIGWLAGLYMFAGIGSIYLYFSGFESVFTKYGVAFLIVGIGLWQRADWARWLAFGFNVLGLIMFTAALFLAPEKFFTMRNGIKYLMVAWTIYELWEWDIDGVGELQTRPGVEET